MPDAAWRRARDLVLRHGWNAVAYQVLNPGMRLWFADDGDAVAGYAAYGGYRIVAGAPVCAPERLPAVAAELERSANAAGERVLFFGAGARLEQVYAGDPGHRLLHLGALPVWDPAAWRDTVAHKASLRAQLHRAANKGIRIEEWAPARVREAPALRDVLGAWLATRGLPPLAFLVTPDLLDNVEDRRTFVATRDGSVLAFLIATPVPARQGWLVEQWPRLPGAPNGTTHLLVDAAMRAFHAGGSRYATLGLAPLALRAGGTHAHEAAWLRGVLHWVRAHGRRFYNFRGLEAFKAGMQPTRWEPVFAIAQGRRFTPGMLHAVAGAFSNGAPEWLVARALARAARDELGTGLQRAVRAAFQRA
jgi:phosphatidylglycerol lysyltransferase